MAEIRNFKCPCCGAALVFDGVSQTLECSSCGNSFEVETLKQLDECAGETAKQSKFDWEHYEPRSYEPDGEIDLASYSCPSCGAEIAGDNNLGATICPYCGNSTIVKRNFEGTLRPDYIIPFKTDKSGAMRAFENACANAPFLPKEFKDKRVVEKMTGVYVPYWMFDCDCEASAVFNATRVSAWSDGRFDYVKTDFYKLIRAGNISFANVPVDASSKTDNRYMEGVEPFDYGAAVDFNAGYLSGYLADRYDVSADDSIERANERVKNTAAGILNNTAAGFYASIIPESSRVSFSGGKIRYSLLPVWMLNIKYMDKMYKYVINGQTGKVSGEFPTSKAKKARFFAAVFGVTFAACAACVWLFTNMM